MVKSDNLYRERETHSLRINAPRDRVFPLACPVEELKWIDGWAYEMIYSESGRNEEDCIFVEEMSAGHIMGPERTGRTFWVTTLYDPPGGIINFLLVRDTTLTRFEILMRDADRNATEVQWRMTITALSEEAHGSFDEGLKDRMRSMMVFLGESLKHYCETGAKRLWGS